MLTSRSRLLFHVATLAAAILLPFTGAQARSLNQILSSGEIRVGVNPNYPPAALYNNKNQLAGFDVDVSNEIAKMLGVKLHLVVVDPTSRITFLTSDKIDYVMAGMTRTPERAKVIDFTVPVNTEAFGLVTKKGATYKSIADMNDPSVMFAEVRGTTPVIYLQQNLPKAKLLLLANWPDAYRAVRDGRATAVIEEGASMEKELKQLADVPWKMIPGAFGPVYYDCMGVEKGNDSLRTWLNVALFKLESEGVIDKIWRKWYGADMVVKVVPNPYF
jgi:polar amino acid transport system substrate-binding protein